MAACVHQDGLVFTPPDYGPRLLSGLCSLQNQSQLYDVTITVDKTRFIAHRVVLSACSPYFRAMFVGQLSEHSQSEVSLHGVCPKIFGVLLDFVYSGSVDITTDNCTDLLAAADMFQISEVVSGCCEFLKQNLAPDNCIGIYLFADAHSSPDLKVAAEVYIHQNFLQVCHQDEFYRMPKDMLIFLLHSENLHIETEFQVFSAAFHWILHDVSPRRKTVFEVMSPIRFPLISQKQLDKFVEQCSDLSLKIALKKLMQDFQLNRNICLELRLNRLKPYLTHPRKSAQKSIFVIGGYSRQKGGRWSDSQSLNIVEKFDTYHQQWQSMPGLQYARSGHGVAVLNGLIYVIGGESDSLIYDTAECYDPAVSSWSTVACMMMPRCGLGVCSMNDCLFVLGGWVGSEIGDTIERYDPGINKWQTVGRMITLRFTMGVTAHQGLIYVIGGMNDLGTEMKTLESYNPVTHEWIRLADMSTRRAFVGTAVLEGHLYAVGGWNEHDGTLATVEKFSIEENRWVEVLAMPTPRAGACVSAVNGMLYVIGGRSSSHEYSAPSTLYFAECYDPQTDSWIDLNNMPTSRCDAAVAVM